MRGEIVASRLTLFVKIINPLIFVLVIAGISWHIEFFIPSIILLVLSFSAEHQLIKFKEKLSRQLIIPQLEGEVIDGINWLLDNSQRNDPLENIFQQFQKYSTQNISRQELLEIAKSADMTIKLRNGELWIYQQKTHV